eukprot:COSAG01_NODE_522_length_15953_cov_207.754715_1_plen_469_part_00
MIAGEAVSDDPELGGPPAFPKGGGSPGGGLGVAVGVLRRQQQQRQQRSVTEVNRLVVLGGGQASEAGGLLGDDDGGINFDVDDGMPAGPSRASFNEAAAEWFQEKFALRLCGKRVDARMAKMLIGLLCALPFPPLPGMGRLALAACSLCAQPAVACGHPCHTPSVRCMRPVGRLVIVAVLLIAIVVVAASTSAPSEDMEAFSGVRGGGGTPARIVTALRAQLTQTQAQRNSQDDFRVSFTRAIAVALQVSFDSIKVLSTGRAPAPPTVGDGRRLQMHTASLSQTVSFIVLPFRDKTAAQLRDTLVTKLTGDPPELRERSGIYATGSQLESLQSRAGWHIDVKIGCTDRRDTDNYSPDAEYDDGSCVDPRQAECFERGGGLDWWVQYFGDEQWKQQRGSECDYGAGGKGFLSTCGNYKQNGCWCPAEFHLVQGQCSSYSALLSRNVTFSDSQAKIVRFWGSFDDYAVSK